MKWIIMFAIAYAAIFVSTACGEVARYESDPGPIIVTIDSWVIAALVGTIATIALAALLWKLSDRFKDATIIWHASGKKPNGTAKPTGSVDVNAAGTPPDAETGTPSGEAVSNHSDGKSNGDSGVSGLIESVKQNWVVYALIAAVAFIAFRMCANGM